MSGNEAMDTRIDVEGDESYVPVQVNPGRILRAIARIGYTPESAICDIVDNSVNAGATTVAIELDREPDMAENRRNSAARYIIADDGRGMDQGELVSSLALGVQGDYTEGSLGKYGLGLKSAGLSQGNLIEVLSSCGNDWKKVVLDVRHVELTGRLECQVLDPNPSDRAKINRLLADQDHGTIVSLEEIHKRNHPSIRKTREALQKLLGVTYLYFLQDTEERSFKIALNGEEVAPFDPLFVDEANSNGDLDDQTWDGRDVRWLEEPTPVPLDPDSGVTATVEATQLVHPPAFENPAEVRKKYMIGAGHYGFYVYRNKRLIRWAERFDGLVPTDQDYFAFRGRILIDESADDVLNIDVKKSEVLLNEDAEMALSDAIYEARRKSRQGWLRAGELLKRVANQDPVAKADEALSDVDFPDVLPKDPDDEHTEGERRERARKEAGQHPLSSEEREQAHKAGSRVVLVDQIDDNALWERAYDSRLGTIVRLNRSHRFTRLFYDRFGAEADVVLLFHAFLLSLAVGESGAVRNLQAFNQDDLESIFQRYRDQSSAAIYKVTADALEMRLA